MNTYIRQILFLLIVIGAFIFPNFTVQAAEKLPIGARCFNNSDCQSGDCEENSNGKYYCDCSTAANCAEAYKPLLEGEVWECKDGANATYDLDYCVSNVRGVQYPIPPKELSGVDSFTDPSLSLKELAEAQRKPELRINLPGLNFRDVQVLTSVESGSSFLFIPFLADYLSAAYRYAIVVASIISVLAIIGAGFLWTVSGGDAGTIQKAKKIIGNAVIGLVLAVGSYTILYTINPELVSFSSLKVRYVEGIPFEALYDEGGSEPDAVKNTGVGYISGNPTPKGSEKCIYDNFTPGIKIGEKPEVVQINFLGLGTIPFNKRAADALRRVESELLSSQDKEVIGYIQYMRDVKAKKAPDMLGTQDGQGVISNFLGRGIGVGRKSGHKLGKLTYDMHVMGLAVDIMTRSNWDIHWGGTSKGKPAQNYCHQYKNTLEKMKKGDYGEDIKKDPYNMFDRLDKKIKNCLNKFDNGRDPYTTMPDEFVKAFTRNGFYWGGYGWGNKMRSDSMHFEYHGNCQT